MFYKKVFSAALCVAALSGLSVLSAQVQTGPKDVSIQSTTVDRPVDSSDVPIVPSVLSNYYNQTNGISLTEIVRRSIDNNGEIKIARLEVDKAKARLTQAGLRSNPTVEVEQTTGRFTGSPGDGEISVGFSMPVDVYGQRGRRIDLAKAEVTLREAELAARQRELTGQIFTTYSEALAAMKELQVLEEILELDTRTTRFVQIRVNEGESSPLELNLLQTEVERLRARRTLAEGKLAAALTKLKFYAAMSYDEPLKLREEISTAGLPQIPTTVETGFAVALRSRPEIRVADLERELATAGLRLIRAQSKPDVTAYTRYTQGRAGYDDPRGEFFQRDRSLTFGIAIGLPLFDKKQGERAEAEVAIRQAQERRAFAEQVIKNEVAIAFQRMAAANSALSRLETAVLPRSQQNIETVRQVYQIGELKITDLIAEQRRLLDANRDITETLTERYRAQADLFIALGLTLEN